MLGRAQRINCGAGTRHRDIERAVERPDRDILQTSCLRYECLLLVHSADRDNRGKERGILRSKRPCAEAAHAQTGKKDPTGVDARLNQNIMLEESH